MIDLSDAPVSALLELHGDLLAELRESGVLFEAPTILPATTESCSFREHLVGR
jgi:hypothetical protein